MSPNAIPWYITHVSYAFAKIMPDGRVTNGDPVDIGRGAGCNADGLYYQLYQLKATRPYLKTILSVGGWNYRNQYLPVMSDNVKRATFIRTAVALALNYGFDGLDVDWEYPNTPDEGKYYVLMMKQIRQALNIASKADNKIYLLTTAIPSSQYLLRSFWLDQSRHYIDWYNLMAYDASVGTKNAVHQSPLYNSGPDSADAVISFMRSKGVARGQIVLGNPLYAHQYNVAINDVNKGLGSVKTSDLDTWLTNKEVQALIQSGEYTRYFDTNAQVPWLYCPSKGLFVTYDDVQSISSKVKYVNKKNLRGVFFWELNQDYLTERLDVAIIPNAQEVMTGLTYWPSLILCAPQSKFCNINCNSK